jgi:SAM-dependent methyltransferase
VIPGIADPQYRFWSNAFAGVEYYYGEEPGPIARRAVRYHRPFMPRGGAALDAGCGEGQDLAFLAERGYDATGIDFTPTGAEKTRRLLRARGLEAEVLTQDLRNLGTEEDALAGRHFDLVLAVNTLQFMGPDGSRCLDRLRDMVRPGGVIGLSLFAREEGWGEFEHGCWMVTLQELIARFPGWQMLEVARVWQWNPLTSFPQGERPQAFVTLIARRREG